MTGKARYVIFSVTEKVIWSQEEDMPVAFTEEQQAEIRKKLYDAAKNMAAIPEEKKTAQMEAEKELFWKFLNQFGPLAVSEELAFTSLRALIMTVYSREKLGPDYATILRWMAQGVCSHIF